MSRLPKTRPARPLARRVRKTCRWPVSWPRKPIWVKVNARNTAVANCHQEPCPLDPPGQLGVVAAATGGWGLGPVLRVPLLDRRRFLEGGHARSCLIGQRMAGVTAARDHPR